MLNSVVLAAGFVVLIILVIAKRSPARRRLPPGPKPLPVIGNARDIPVKAQWETFTKWAKAYGDIVHVSALGNHIVVLNTIEAVKDILEKRSALYSNRPYMPMITDMIGMDDWAFSVMNQGARWSAYKKAFLASFSPVASKAYQPIQTVEVRKLLRRLLETPDDLVDHLHHTSAAIIMRVTYGIQLEETEDRYIAIAEAAVSSVREAGIPGAYLVDLFPILQHIPAWFPGAGFKHKAARFRNALSRLIHVPFEAAESAIKSGSSTASMVSNALENASGSDDPAALKQMVRGNAALAYSGGYETSSSVMQVFFLAMVLYPEVQRKAQAELDAVVGTNRLPEFSDMESLPYMQAIVKETLRWLPVLPIGFPHSNSEDDEYKGYHIPKKSIVMANVWNIFHDEKAFPDPHTFKPERFLKNGSLDSSVFDPATLAFGFGRRICPGRHMGFNTEFITFASVLSCFNIEQAVDASGAKIPVEPSLSSDSGAVCAPKPFKCSIKPRSDASPLIYRTLKEGD